MFVTTQMPAVNSGFPDTCIMPLVPAPLPTPFPNFSTSITAIPTVPNIFIWAMPAHNNLTIATTSIGCPMPGILSGMVSGSTRMLVSSVKTFYCGMPVNKCFGTTGQNGMPPYATPFNCPGTQISPSQVTVMVLT